VAASTSRAETRAEDDLITGLTLHAAFGHGRGDVGLLVTRARGSAGLVTVTTTQSGTVIVSGKGLKTTKKTLGAGTHVIGVPLTSAGKAARRHHCRMEVRVSAKYSDVSARPTKTVRIKP
jgi:hypothetical protein